MVEGRKRAGQPAEIAVTRGADGGAVGGGVLMRDLCADGGVHRDRHVVGPAGQQNGGFAAGEFGPGR